MRKTITVHLKNGETVGTSWQGATPEEVDGWEHMLTTTVEGEGLRDVGVAILVDHPMGGAQSTTYIVADFIASVSIR